MAEGTTTLLLILIGVLVYWIEVSKRKRSLPLPPGPKPLPLIGNLLDLPKERPWITYRDWSNTYGSDILFIDLPRHPTVIVNSIQAAIDLLEKRSKLYSGRLLDVMDELVGWSWNLAFQPYGQRWRDTRRCFHQHFNQAAVKQYHPATTREVRLFLKRALCSEQEIDVKSVSLTFAAVILDVTYGIRIQSLGDELAMLSQRAVEGLVASKMSGTFWVEFFPWLKHVPSWVPGSRARQVGDHYRPIVEATRSLPFNAAAEAITAGTAAPSVAQRCIQKLRAEFSVDGYTSAKYRYKEEICKDATGVAYAAAIDTQTSTACWFFVALSFAPEAQRQAQAELDAVLGSKLPTMADLAKLPYIQAIALEVIRWAPIVPLSINHRLLAGKDDEYAGYLLPGGSAITPNVWAMLHNPVDYPDPERFNPDRFIRNGHLDLTVRNPMLAAFGFGRRICPGRYLATDSITLLIASVLAVFNIESTIAESECTPPMPTTGLISYPESVPCRLRIRHAPALALINSDPDPRT